MSWQNRDIKKLKRYINSLGLKLYMKPYNSSTGSAEYVSGESITIFRYKTSKTEMILSLLHELGHHLDWLYGKKEDKLAQESLILLNKGLMIGDRPDLSKKHRKKIFEIEKNGIKYMETLYKDLKLEIPYYKVKHQQDIDLFDYQWLYEYGRFPTRSEATNKIYKKVGYYKRKYGKRS